MNDPDLKKLLENLPPPAWFPGGPFPTLRTDGFYLLDDAWGRGAWDKYPRRNGMVIMPAPKIIRIPFGVGATLEVCVVKGGKVFVPAAAVDAALAAQLERQADATRLYDEKLAKRNGDET